MIMSEPILEMKNISKRFGSVVALDDVSLTVYPGEIRGLIGENGSGKSTISSIAAGMQKANEGQMIFKNKEWNPESMIDALTGGIGMVVQESGTIAGITVAENIFLAPLSRLHSMAKVTFLKCKPNHTSALLPAVSCPFSSPRLAGSCPPSPPHT